MRKKKVVLVKPDRFGWIKASDIMPDCGEILTYDSDFDHICILDPKVDSRTFTHWQELPRYPWGIFDED